MDGHDGGQLAMLMSVDGAIGSDVVFWCCRCERERDGVERERLNGDRDEAGERFQFL